MTNLHNACQETLKSCANVVYSVFRFFSPKFPLKSRRSELLFICCVLRKSKTPSNVCCLEWIKVCNFCLQITNYCSWNFILIFSFSFFPTNFPRYLPCICLIRLIEFWKHVELWGEQCIHSVPHVTLFCPHSPPIIPLFVRILQHSWFN
jgi:hypothetical protein